MKLTSVAKNVLRLCGGQFYTLRPFSPVADYAAPTKFPLYLLHLIFPKELYKVMQFWCQLVILVSYPLKLKVITINDKIKS